jgi:hypothetical protein
MPPEQVECSGGTAGAGNTKRSLTHPSGCSRIGGLAVDATPEEWLPVVGREGQYEVSSHGRAQSLDRVIRLKDGRERLFVGRMLKLRPTPTGYLQFGIGGRLRKYIHRAVLEAFVGPCPEGMEACHNDSDPSNNHVSNLRWDTRFGNCQDIKALGSHANTQKTRCPEGHQYDGVIYGPAMKAAGLRPRRYCKTCRNNLARERYVWKENRR